MKIKLLQLFIVAAICSSYRTNQWQLYIRVYMQMFDAYINMLHSMMISDDFNLQTFLPYRCQVDRNTMSHDFKLASYNISR